MMRKRENCFANNSSTSGKKFNPNWREKRSRCGRPDEIFRTVCRVVARRGAPGEHWCAREDLNLQPFRDQILSLARLPFRHARKPIQVAPRAMKSQARFCQVEGLDGH